jgi:hypothetical protein
MNGMISLTTTFLIGLGYGAMALVSAHFRRLPLGVFIIVAAFPVVGWFFTGSLPLTLGYLAMVGMMVIRRLTAPQPVSITSISRKQVLLNRLLFDRDLREKEAWMSLVSEHQAKQLRLTKSRR